MYLIQTKGGIESGLEYYSGPFDSFESCVNHIPDKNSSLYVCFNKSEVQGPSEFIEVAPTAVPDWDEYYKYYGKPADEVDD